MTYRELLSSCDIVTATANDSLRVSLLCAKIKFLVEDERLEAKYMGIGVGRLPLNTRLMYFDLLDMESLD